MSHFIIGLFIMIGVMVGCSSAPPQKIIDLSDLSPLAETPKPDIIPLRVSVAAVISPRSTVESYQPLLDYLSKALQRPVELVQRRTYQETNDLLESGEVDIAFVCTSAYVIGHDDFNMRLLVAPSVNGNATYQSFLIVPTDSQAQTIADLQQTVFAFTDPISNSGRVYPTYLVQQLGYTPETFFKRTFFTYSHDDAIYAVANGLADGAAVDSLVYEYALERNPTLAQKIRVIHQSPTFGIPPVVISPNLRPQTIAMLQEVLLNMKNTSDGKTVLSALGIDDFILIEDSAYESARTLISQVGDLP